MKIAFNPSTVAALTTPPNNKDITFDLKGRNIFARGVKFYGTDTNTWRPVVDNLTSNSTTSSLSANQGRVLKALIDGKSDSGHNHDGRYLKLTGGTMTSNALIRFADSGSWGTDKGPQGARGGLYWSGQSDYAKLYAEETAGNNLDLVIQFGDDNSNGLSIRNKSNVQTSYISAGGVITTGTFKGNLDWSYITNKPATATRWPSWAEVTGKPSSFTPSTHTHGLSNSVFFLNMPSISGNAKWKEVFGYPVNYNLLLSVRINSPAPEWCVGNYGSGILYGGSDTKGFMSSAYNEPLIMWAGGNGSSDDSVPKWYIGIRGTHKSIYNLTTIASEANAAYNLRHSHANKAVLDGITSGLVSNWNTAYTFVHTITGTDTDKVINKWDEIVNFLAGITEDNKLNTLLNSKLSVYELADKTNVGTIKNNGIYYSTTEASTGTLTNSPFTNAFALINMTNLNNNEDQLRRCRLAFSRVGDIKVSDDHLDDGTAETWYNVLTSKNSGIDGSTIKLNGTSITVYSSGTADGRYVKKSGDTMTGVLTIDTTNFGTLTIKRNDDANGASIQFRGKSSVYGYIGLNNSTKDKQFLRWNSDTSKVYTILDTSSTYTSSGKGVINGTTITQVDNATNATNSTNARKLVNWYSARPTSLNAQFGDGSLRVFYATSSTTEGKSPDDATVLHLAWDNNGGWDSQLAIGHSSLDRVYLRSQNNGTWGSWKTLAFTTDIPSSLKNPHSFNVFGVTYDGSAAKTVTTSTFISQVNEGTSTITDGTMLITSYASNSGFADTNAVNVPYKRKAVHLWEYIKAKTDSLYATKNHNHDGRYVRTFGTSNDNIDSDWGESFKTFDPIPSGTPPEQGANISLLSIGNSFNRRKQLAFIYNNDNIYYRRHVDNRFSNWRRLAFANEIPTSLKNPHALTISLNGTSQGPYDGSAAKNINITPGSIGAATSGHNHDGRYVYNYGGTAANGQALNQNALFMSTTSGITGNWWHILQAAWSDEYRWNSQIAFPTQNRNGMYYRSGLDDNTKWGSWVKLLDINNYSSTLDSRYYTESEVNSLLSKKLDRVNLSVGTWNPRGYNLAADYHYNGGDLSISENSGKMYVSIDGQFYQNDGQYRVLDTSDIGSIRGGLILYQYLSATDANWYPLVWGGSDHKNTNNSTGSLYKSYDKLSWQTSSQTLYATNIQTENIKHLSIGGGIYWNPYVESATDGSDAASITLVKSGVAGGTTLVLSQMNDANDTIQFKTSTTAKLYHNSYPILTTQNTYVNNHKGYIYGTEITQVNNSNSSDRTRALRYSGTGSSEITAYQTDSSYMGRSGWASYIICNHGDGSKYYSQTIAMPFWSSPIYRRLEDGTDRGWKKFYTEENPPSWDNVINKPSSFTPSSHTHTWASITDKLVAGNEFNIVNAGFKESMWFNYLPINDRSKTATISSYHFGNGAKGYTSIIASGFIKSGGNASQLLRADGGVAAFNWSGQSGQPTWLWGGNSQHSYYVYNPSNFRVAYAASAGNADTLDSYHESSFLRYRGATSTDQETTLWSQIGIKQYNNALPDDLTNVYNYGSVISLPGSSSRFEIYAPHGASAGNGLYYRSGWNNDKKPWLKFIDSSNIGSQTVTNAYHLRINSANSWSTWNWAGQSGQPSWLWGSNDGTNMYVWNPSNFRVAYASSAGNADTVDGYHATDGRTFNGNINWSNNWSDAWSDGTNKHPWYGFDHRYPNTGAYSTTITDYFGMTIKTANTLRLDFGTLLLNGVDIHNINVASASKLQTARNIALGTDLRGSANFDGSSNIIINANINACTIRVSSTNELPFKRIAHFETGNSYNDNALLLYISQGYINGSNGICRVEFRTNNISSSSTSITASAAVRWLVRNGYGLDSLYAGYYVTAGKAYIDIYLKTTGGYQGTVIRVLQDSRGGINSNVQLINSHYYSDTDHKEAYGSIEAASTALYNRAYTRIVQGSDIGTVSYSNSTGSVHWNNVTNKPSSFNPAAHNHDGRYLRLDGSDIMTGILKVKANQSNDGYDGAINMNNSNIYGLNSIYTSDKSESQAEGIHFWRDTTHVDTLRMMDGKLLFTPNRPLGKSGTEQTVLHTGNSSVSGQTITINGNKTTWTNTWRPLGTGANDAAAGNHTHDYLIINEADTNKFNSSYHNFQVLYAGGSNGIEGRPKDVDAFGLFRFRVAAGFSGQILLANGGDLYIRSAADASLNKSLPWKRVIDSGNIGSQSVAYASKAGSVAWANVTGKPTIPNPTDYYWANIKVSASSNTQTKPSVNTIYANNWFRSQGASGWYSESYGGGIYMSDTTWIRTFGDKPFYCNKQIYSSDSIRMGDIYLQNKNEINNGANGILYLNSKNAGNISLGNGGGCTIVGPYTTGDTGNNKLFVNGSEFIQGASNVRDHVYADGFRHRSHNSNDSVLLAGGGYSVGCIIKYWAIYSIYLRPTTVNFSKMSGNHSFISTMSWEKTGSAILEIKYPSGFSESSTMIFGNGDHQGYYYDAPVYVTISKNYDGNDKLRITLANDTSLDEGEAYLYFLCMG